MAGNRKIVSRDEWLEARKKLLSKEKEFTRLRDELGRERREMSWEPVKKNYVFEGPNRKESPAQLFDGTSQLIVHHFMSIRAGKPDARTARSGPTTTIVFPST
jgi:predicted dithiol-disulfide oxidoreductase (DUF899 family)